MPLTADRARWPRGGWRWLLVLLSLLPVRAAAQCTVSAPPAGCPVPFVALDAATGQEVQTLCEGRPVRFQPGCGRVVVPNLLYYNALPGANVTPTNCDFVPGQLANNTFTPTAAGPLTVSELTNPSMAGGVGTVYVRNFQVVAAPAPTFTLAPCPAGLVRLTIMGGGYDRYVVLLNGAPVGGPLATGASATLAALAGSSLTVVGQYLTNALCTKSASQTVPALAPPTTPVLTGLTVGGPLPGSLRLDLSAASLPAGYLYDVQRADPSAPTGWRRVASVAAGSPTMTLSGAVAGQYRVGRRDVCRTDSAFSAAVPTIELSASAGNNVNNLSWLAAGPVLGYTLLRDGTALTTLPAGATTYADATVSCGTRYRYQLRASVVGGATSVSAEETVLAVSTLAPPAPFVLASFDLRDRLTLTASGPGGSALPASSQVVFSRQGGPADVDFAAQPAGDTLRDPTDMARLLAAPPCYAARLIDVCGNAASSAAPTCPVLLRAEAADPDGLSARLSWSAFRGPGGPGAPVSYRVLTLAANGSVLAASAPTAALSYLDSSPPADRQTLRYRVEASGAGLPAGSLSYSNIARLTRRVKLIVPNAFTPNGDGLNDVLELKGRYINGFTFVVIDRNGQEAFRATDRAQTWDGTIRGHAPVNGAYVWRLTLRDEAGAEFVETGTVTILK